MAPTPNMSPALCRAAWVAVAAMSALEADAAVEDKSMDADAACRDEPDAMVVAVAVRNCCELQTLAIFIFPPVASALGVQGPGHAG